MDTDSIPSLLSVADEEVSTQWNDGVFNNKPECHGPFCTFCDGGCRSATDPHFSCCPSDENNMCKGIVLIPINLTVIDGQPVGSRPCCVKDANVYCSPECCNCLGGCRGDP